MNEIKEEELTLPRSTIKRIIKIYNKKNKIFNETVKSFIMKCALEFIHLISLDANEVCELEKKKTITCEHILKSLKNLGFEDFINKCEKYYKLTLNKNKKKTIKIDKLKASGLTKEEYEKQQLELFANAKLKYQQEEEEEELNEEK